MIKAILFDLGGVCLSGCFGKENRKKVANNFSIPFDKMEVIYKKFELDINTGKKEFNDFLNELKTLNPKLKPSDIKEYVYSLNYANEKMIELIKKLKEKYILATLNNESKEFDDFRKRRFNLERYFHYFFPSCNVGFIKPDKRIFEFALEKLQLSPPDILFVDNNETNVEAAKRLGMNSLLFKDVKSFKKELLKIGVLN